MNKMFRGFLTEQPLLNADTGMSEGGAPTNVDNASAEQTTPDVAISDAPQGNDNQPNNTVSEIEIEGFGKVRVDELKEWKSGYMRQADYTKKTQEVARSRQENKEAMEVYNYLKNNPQIAQSLSQGDYSAMQNNPVFAGVNPVNSQIENLNMKLAGIELDGMLSNLKSQYPDFNEIEVLTEADRLGITDLEFVFNAMQGKKLPALKEQLTKEIERSITDKIKNNGLGTQSIINTNDSTAIASNGLSDMEINIARKMGLSPEVYAKGKTKK